MSPKEEIKKTSTKIDCISYLSVSINKSVPGPMRSIGTVGQTVARYSLVSIIPPLSRNFGNCCFPPKVNLQPFITIVSARAPRPGLTRSWDLVKAGKLGNVIGIMICRCWYRAVGKMATLHSQRQKTATSCKTNRKIETLQKPYKEIPTYIVLDFLKQTVSRSLECCI